MPIKFRCEHCRQLLGISKSKAGQVVDCPTCGRAVSVPSLDGKSAPVSIPKLNLNDDVLVNALDALAGLGSIAKAPPPPHDPATTDDEHDQPLQPSPQDGPVTLPPAPVPEPVELPPLEKPVAIVEPAPLKTEPVDHKPSQPAITSAPPPDKGRHSNSVPEREDDPAAPLRSLAAAIPPPRPVTEPQSVGTSTGTPLTFALVAGLAFATGFLVHAQFFSDHAPDNTNVSEKENPKASTSPAPANNPPASNDVAVRGRITFRTPDGSSQPDSGACVIFLPVQRSGSAKLIITGFRPADDQDDRNIARTTIRAIGGELALVNESGNYTADLKQSGSYHVIVLSHFQERPIGEDGLTPAVRTLLTAYFDRPEQLAGKRRYALGELRYRGEGTEEWDYLFERS